MLVILIAGCLPSATADLPGSFLAAFGDGATFTMQPPPAGVTGQDVVAALRAGASTTSMVNRHAVPVFGTLDCHANPQSTPGPSGGPGLSARTVWVIVYPDCTDGSDVGWVVVDAVDGIGSGYMQNDLCGDFRRP